MPTKADFSRALFVLVGSGVTIAFGTYMAPPTDAMNAMGAATIVAGNTLANLGAGLITALTHDGIKSGFARASEWLHTVSQRGVKLPANHDVARAVARSHISALRFLVEELQHDLTNDHAEEYDHALLDPFCKAALRWLDRQLKEIQAPDYFSNMPIDQALREVTALIDQSADYSPDATLRGLHASAANSALREFVGALNIREAPGAFEERFRGERDSVGWVLAAHSFFAEELKSNGRVRTAVFLDLLDRSVGAAAETNARLDKVLGDLRLQGNALTQRFNRLDEEISKLSERKISIDNEGLRIALIGALAHADFVGALRRRVAVEAPADAWAAETARIDVRNRIAELSASFYGRAHELAELDALIDDHDRGLAVITAPAGRGKSALLARWLVRRCERGDIVARHFISSRWKGTTDPIAALRHLSAQLRDIDATDPHHVAERIPFDPLELNDKLVARLGRQVPGGERLIVLIDGLDELVSPLRDIILRETLAEGVFVVVSGRAGADERPSYLWPWLGARLGDVPIWRYDLPGLDAADILLWLGEIIGHLDEAEMRSIAKSLHATTEGVPLFLSFVIDDLRKQLPSASTREARRTLVDDLPAPFSGYVARELRRLSDAMPADWTRWASQLFALLTCTRGPIREDEIKAFFAFSHRADAALPAAPHLSGIDLRITRWLSIREDETRRFFAFTHPRLATAFATALGDEAESTELRLIDWMKSAWRGETTLRGLRSGAPYALDWLPDHLISLGEQGQRDAAHLYCSPTFLAAQLFEPGAAVRRLRATVDGWNILVGAVKADIPGAARWEAFWAENETALLLAVEIAARIGCDAARPILNCLGDAETAGADRRAPRPLALAPVPPAKTALVRSLADAHHGQINGMLAVGNRLISWGWDGAIRFWTMAGARADGGNDQAHKFAVGVTGLLPVGDRLVSWGHDGTIRFWTLAGERADGGNDHAHNDVLNGVLPVGDRLVSWGNNGTLRFWTLAGERAEGGDDKAHKFAVNGVLPVGDRLVSWGSDGAIRFWTLAGERAKGGNDRAHNDAINGVLRVGDRLVSWGHDGAIRFWTLAGERAEGGDDRAHETGVKGILPVGDRLVSWGEYDGAIRFWTSEGARAMGGDDQAHNGPINGVLRVGDRLVSWGSDGAIRFWSLAGEHADGGDDQAHSAVKGVLPVGDRLVSWGSDGAIRFWSLAGEHADGGDDQAHSAVKGVLPVGDRLVSWGSDGAIRFWTPAGERAEGVDDQAHNGQINGVLPVGDRLVSWGQDGAIRFWTPAGEHAEGGDDQAHNDVINGVLPVGDRLVSWGSDGAIRFWTPAGERAKGGDDRAHNGAIIRVLPVGDRLVSWGRDDAIRFWTLAGERAEGGDDHAHKFEVKGVLAVGIRLVSWGWDGAIRFWTLEGARAEGGDDHAHNGAINGVLPVGDRLVSWGTDGAIRFWTLVGERADGGDDQAHIGAINGVLLVGDRLVSWGRIGAIRFWTLAGERAEGGDDRAHTLGVRNVLRVGDRLVSWGEYDCTIRFWTLAGERADGGDEAAHRWGVGGVGDVLPVGDRLVSWGKYDGTIRLWSHVGIALSVFVPPGGVNFASVVGDSLIVAGRTLWVYPVTALERA